MNAQLEQCVLTPTVTVCLSGSGGQGLILAGRLLAEAAALHDGLDVIQTNSYGPEARGGASRSEVVLGHGEIDVLHAPAVDVLVCLNQASCDAYYEHLVGRGLLITDADLVKVVPTTRALEVPMSALAREKAGNVMSANVVALAVLSAVSNIISREALVATIKERLPPALQEGNLKAIAAGFAAAEEIFAGRDKSHPRRAANSKGLFPDFSYLRQGTRPPQGLLRGAASDSAASARAAVSRAEMLRGGNGRKPVGA